MARPAPPHPTPSCNYIHVRAVSCKQRKITEPWGLQSERGWWCKLNGGLCTVSRVSSPAFSNPDRSCSSLSQLVPKPLLWEGLMGRGEHILSTPAGLTLREGKREKQEICRKASFGVSTYKKFLSLRDKFCFTKLRFPVDLQIKRVQGCGDRGRSFST